MREYIMFTLIGICLVLTILSFITDSMPKKRRLLLSLMAFATVVMLVADRLTYFYDGNPSTIGFFVVRVGKIFTYGESLIITYIFNLYLKDLLSVEGGVRQPLKSLKIAEYILFAGATLIVISQYTGLYYTFDESNTYQRSSGYILSYLVPSIVLAIQLATIIRHRKDLKTWFLPLSMFILMPLAATITQFFVHGVSLTSISVVSMLILLYCFSVLDTNRVIRDAHKREVNALLEKQENINLMVEQTTSALAEAIDAKDSYTNGHSWRVAEYSVMIARKAGKSEEECRDIHLTALLHDVGKIGIPDIIINKSGRLTDKEYNVIKSHPLVGREILSKISISPELAIGASFHHERYDGKGYPFGLKGEEIPEVARIVAVADTYDAMASKRSYRDVLSKQKIRSELEKGIGSQFDPKFARIMIELIDSGVTLEVEEKYLKSTG